MELQPEPTAIDLVLGSVQKIVRQHNIDLAGGFPLSAAEWRVLHHDLWASYATYLYDLQHQEEPIDAGPGPS